MRRTRADAARNAGAVLEAATAVFAASGVDTPMREIAARAGVGVGTVYRAFPRRSDLIIAVFRQEVDATAAEADRLAAAYPPPEALRRWARRLALFVETKRGFAKALHAGDPAYASLPAHVLGALAPCVQGILDAGVREGSLRADVRAEELISALLNLMHGTVDADGSGRMIGVFLDGLSAQRGDG